MAKITKSVTFDDERDAELLAWLNGKPNFSRFVRRALYRAKEGPGAPALTIEAVRLAMRDELRRLGAITATPAAAKDLPLTEDAELEQNLDNLFG